MTETQEKKAVYDIVFGVHVHPDNLFSAKVIKLKDGKISEWKHGRETSMGHALSIAQELLGAYALQSLEKGPIAFYDDVRVI